MKVTCGICYIIRKKKMVNSEQIRFQKRTNKRKTHLSQALGEEVPDEDAIWSGIYARIRLWGRSRGDRINC